VEAVSSAIAQVSVDKALENLEKLIGKGDLIRWWRGPRRLSLIRNRRRPRSSNGDGGRRCSGHGPPDRTFSLDGTAK